jgi:hypothetical protein
MKLCKESEGGPVLLSTDANADLEKARKTLGGGGGE